MKEFYSNGKLLISGEYVVLDGALVLALPTKFGQSLQVEEISDPCVYWTCFDADGSIWMKEQITIKELLSDQAIEGSSYLQTLVKVLRAAHQQNENVLNCGIGYKVEAYLTFPRLWGLGTSSTWINNVAQWFFINPYQLLRESFGGSGYDIACAQNNTAITYQLDVQDAPAVNAVELPENFFHQMYFVYLNQKQDSKEGIATYKKNRGNIQDEINRISEITQTLLTVSSVEEMESLLKEHEQIIGKITKQQPIQERLFSDFIGTIKSLGAWGGDFILVLSQENPTVYFKTKGFDTIIPFTEMIK